MALESCPRDLQGEHLAFTPCFLQWGVEVDVWSHCLSFQNVVLHQILWSFMVLSLNSEEVPPREILSLWACSPLDVLRSCWQSIYPLCLSRGF